MLKKKLLELGLTEQQSDEVIKIYNQSVNQNKIQFAVENSLIKNKARNIKAASALIDFDSLKSDENGVYGIDEQIQALKNNEETAFLFDSDKSDGKFSGAKPEEGIDRDKYKNPRKMTYTELCKFLK